MKQIVIKQTPNPAEPYVTEIKGGSISYDEALNMMLMSLLSMMKQSTHNIKIQHPEEVTDDTPIRALLYDKTVIAFSAMVDIFFPEKAKLTPPEEDLKNFESFLKKKNKEAKVKSKSKKTPS